MARGLGREVVDCNLWEQLAWRRVTIRTKCRGSSRIMDEEHPRDPHSCFIASGHKVFDEDAMARIQIACRRESEHGQINGRDRDRRSTWVKSMPDAATVQRWERPVVGCKYICTVDLAEGEDQTKGEDPDRHSALILRDEYMDMSKLFHRTRLVARVKSPNRMPMIPFAKLVRLLSVYFGRCVIIPEMNNSGMSFITALRMLPDPPPIWQRREMDPQSGRERTWDGWRTTDNAEYGGLRSTIIWHLHDALRHDRIQIECPNVHSELVNFVDKKGRMEAGTGHDDDVMALAIGYYNLGSATTYAEDVYQPVLPRDLQALENKGNGQALAMNW